MGTYAKLHEVTNELNVHFYNPVLKQEDNHTNITTLPFISQ